MFQVVQILEWLEGAHRYVGLAGALGGLGDALKCTAPAAAQWVCRSTAMEMTSGYTHVHSSGSEELVQQWTNDHSKEQ